MYLSCSLKCTEVRQHQAAYSTGTLWEWNLGKLYYNLLVSHDSEKQGEGHTWLKQVLLQGIFSLIFKTRLGPQQSSDCNPNLKRTTTPRGNSQILQLHYLHYPLSAGMCTFCWTQNSSRPMYDSKVLSSRSTSWHAYTPVPWRWKRVLEL